MTPIPELDPDSSHPIQHDPGAGRFYVHPDDLASLGGGEAYLAYQDTGEVLDYHYVFVSPALRGGTLASDVTSAALEHARSAGRKVRPTCGYVRAFVRRHPRYEELVVGF